MPHALSTAGSSAPSLLSSAASGAVDVQVVTGFHLKPCVESISASRFHEYLVEVSHLLVEGMLKLQFGNSFTETAVEAVVDSTLPARGGKGFIKS